MRVSRRPYPPGQRPLLLLASSHALLSNESAILEPELRNGPQIRPIATSGHLHFCRAASCFAISCTAPLKSRLAFDQRKQICAEERTERCGTTGAVDGTDPGGMLPK